MPIVTMTPAEAADKREIWTSSDPAVATVDALGNIKGVKVGSCTVTVAAAANPSVKAEVAVTVKAAASTTSRPTTKSTAAESVDALVARVSAKVKQPTYIQGILIANKTYGLPRSFDPGADSDMLNAFSKMRKDAAKQGLSLVNSSNYRSYDDQVRLYKCVARRSAGGGHLFGAPRFFGAPNRIGDRPEQRQRCVRRYAGGQLGGEKRAQVRLYRALPQGQRGDHRLSV